MRVHSPPTRLMIVKPPMLKRQMMGTTRRNNQELKLKMSSWTYSTTKRQGGRNYLRLTPSQAISMKGTTGLGSTSNGVTDPIPGKGYPGFEWIHHKL